MNFEIIDISGDVGIRAYGHNCEEAFKNAGTGMYSLITDTRKVNEKQEIEIGVRSNSLEGLLVNYLNELIFRFDAYGFIGKSIRINSIECDTENPALNATVYGENFDPEIHERRLLLKAATYHNIRVEKIDNMWEIEVIFDI